ncbi:MAG TPA: ferredoxin--NADP reductase [Flavobacteriaceae bacterium]|nr:ferredoxin--NADP reductase [Flavobacteriaceae bacterium]
MSNFHKLRVSTINRETADAVSVGFDVPAELEEEFTYTAGQYLTLEKEIAGRKFRRSYSICSSPESGKLKVAVKQIADGRFSSWVNKKLKVGDYLNVFLPEGRFVYEPLSPEKERTFVAFVAGSGITPVMAILQSVLISEPKSKFVLVYGNRTPEDTIFYKDLLELQKEYPDRLYIEFVYSRLEKKAVGSRLRKLFGRKEPAVKKEVGHRGRIEREMVEYIVNDKYKDHSISNFYLCGPEPMINMATEVLTDKGVPEHKIHYELFVTENGKEKGKAKEGMKGKTAITVILDEEEVTFEMDRDKRVLDAAMEEDLDPPYSCRGGICSSCIAQIIEGDVEMVNNQILTKGEIEDGLVLTCQAHPKTDKLIVDYDDV